MNENRIIIDSVRKETRLLPMGGTDSQGISGRWTT